jgi:hypothetical protein
MRNKTTTTVTVVAKNILISIVYAKIHSINSMNAEPKNSSTHRVMLFVKKFTGIFWILK